MGIKKIETDMRLLFPSEKIAETIYQSLLVEADNEIVLTDRVQVKLTKTEKIININVHAEDITIFRAVCNSFLKWITIIEETIEKVH